MKNLSETGVGRALEVATICAFVWVGLRGSTAEAKSDPSCPPSGISCIAPYLETVFSEDVCTQPDPLVEFPIDPPASSIPELVTFPGIPDAPASSIPELVPAPIAVACTAR